MHGCGETVVPINIPSALKIPLPCREAVPQGQGKVHSSPSCAQGHLSYSENETDMGLSSFYMFCVALDKPLMTFSVFTSEKRRTHLSHTPPDERTMQFLAHSVRSLDTGQ